MNRTPRTTSSGWLLLLSCAAACRAPSDDAARTLAPEPVTAAPRADSAATARVAVDGSRTVQPLSQALAAAFAQTNPAVRVDVQASGTGAGLRRFCEDSLDIADASRPINQREAAACEAKHVAYIELPIGFDSLSVVVSAKNDFVDCLTVAELKAMWEPAAQAKLTRWKQVRASFPDTPLALLGPNTDSGSFDYFTAAVVGSESQSRKDYRVMPDNGAIQRGVAADPNALGFFGYSYYLSNQQALKAVAIDGGQGCVRPSAASVADGSYQPLSRPMFLYVNRAAAARPEVRAFTRFYLAPENTKYLQQLGYAPLPTAALLSGSRRLEHGQTGSAMGAHGSVLGVRAADFGDAEERVKNALVQ